MNRFFKKPEGEDFNGMLASLRRLGVDPSWEITLLVSAQLSNGASPEDIIETISRGFRHEPPVVCDVCGSKTFDALSEDRFGSWKCPVCRRRFRIDPEWEMFL